MVKCRCLKCTIDGLMTFDMHKSLKPSHSQDNLKIHTSLLLLTLHGGGGCHSGPLLFLPKFSAPGVFFAGRFSTANSVSLVD